MKSCPQCSQVYNDDSQHFCSRDGATLISEDTARYETQPVTLPLSPESKANRTSDTVSAKYVFLDVVGFTHTRSVEAQAEIVRMLNGIVKGSVSKFRIPTNQVRYIPTGDGICIALLNVDTPLDVHVQIALEILRLIKEHNDMTVEPSRRFQVRIGINANVDNLIEDINGLPNVAGAGISIASRIMDMADGDQILVGYSVYDTLRYREKYGVAFRPYKATVKHGQTVGVYQLIVEGVPGLNTSTPQAFKPADPMASTQGIVALSTEKVTSLDRIEARPLSTSREALQYMAERVLAAEFRIDHAALAPPILRIPGPSQEWEEAIEKVLTAKKVNYRYVALLTDKARFRRAKRHLLNPEVILYFVRYYLPQQSAIMTLSFLLIDECEVVMHYPYDYGQKELYLAIKHPEVGKVFAAYYENLWNGGAKLDRDNLAEVERSIGGGE